MESLKATEIKAFVPARDFELSQRFYGDLGFEKRSEGGGVACFQVDGCAFPLQDFFEHALAQNLVMHLLVPDVRAWFDRVKTQNLGGRYGVRITALEAQPWGITEFVVIDPAGVCWHIGQNTPGFEQEGSTESGEGALSALPINEPCAGQRRESWRPGVDAPGEWRWPYLSIMFRKST